MKSAREVALSAIIKLRREGKWPDLYLKQQCDHLSDEDAALASAITYGVIQNVGMIDFYISSYSSIRLKKIMPQVLDALRIGVYQLVFMDRIPPSAAVNETVSLVKKAANPKAASFANAVLRKISGERERLPQPDKADFLEYLSVKYSHPRWFVEKMTDVLGRDGCEKLLEANNALPAPSARVNTLKTTADKLLLELGGIASLHESVSDALVFKSLRGVLAGRAFQNGEFYIQDIASQLAVWALMPRPGERVLDMCAAPGGKSIMAAQLMENSGSVLSMDLHPHKVDIIMQNANRFGIDIISAIPADATKYIPALKGTADKIICDVPCSGMGIIRKKPDIRFKPLEECLGLPPLQLEILSNAAGYLKPGGSLLYSTCTVLKEENEGVVSAFLAQNPGFSLEPFVLPGGREIKEGMTTLYPHIDGTDGFFIAKIRRLEE